MAGIRSECMAGFIGIRREAPQMNFLTIRDLMELACPIHQGSSNFEVWRSFPPLAATIRGAARGAHLDFIFSG